MLSAIVNACKSFFHRIKETIKNFTKPATAVLAADAASDITRNRKDLIAENAILRQQLIVLKRQVKRPKFNNGDRLRLVFLSRLTQFWDSALHLVQPQTLLRWHHDLFRRYWKRKSRPKYIIRDNDNKFGKKFSAVAKSSGIKELKTPFQAPKANAYCERLIGSMKRECLDHFLIFNQYQLKRIVIAFARYYNQHRAHQGIKQRIPAKLSQQGLQLSNQVNGKVIATPMLNGLHHSDAYAAS